MSMLTVIILIFNERAMNRQVAIARELRRRQEVWGSRRTQNYLQCISIHPVRLNQRRLYSWISSQ
jgi:hypothetical protein